MFPDQVLTSFSGNTYKTTGKYREVTRSHRLIIADAGNDETKNYHRATGSRKLVVPPYSMRPGQQKSRYGILRRELTTSQSTIRHWSLANIYSPVWLVPECTRQTVFRTLLKATRLNCQLWFSPRYIRWPLANLPNWVTRQLPYRYRNTAISDLQLTFHPRVLLLPWTTFKRG